MDACLTTEAERRHSYGGKT